MVATPTAKIFAAEVGLSFDRLAVAAEACGRPTARRILRVSAPTSLAMRWLIPRLGRYHVDHPGAGQRPYPCAAARPRRSGAHRAPARHHGAAARKSVV